MSREIDALVHTEVMGLDQPKRDGNGDAPCPICTAPMWAPDTWPDEGRARCTSCNEWRYSPYPEYSTDWRAAGEVVEKMRGEGYVMDLSHDCYPDGEPADTTVRFWLLPDSGDLMLDGHSADTAPLAICLAALRAKGVEVPS